jgi:hypothetical protein
MKALVDVALLLVAAVLWLDAAAGQQSVPLNAGQPYAVRSYKADNGFGSSFAVGSSYAWVGTGPGGVLYSFSDDDVNKFVPLLTFNGTTLTKDCFEPTFCNLLFSTVKISGSRLLVGMPFDRFMPNASDFKEHGSTLIYDISPGPPVTLTLAARLLPDLSLMNWTDETSSQYGFGMRLAIDGDVVAVTSHNEPAPFQNSVYIFRRGVSGEYALVKRLVNPFGRRIDAYTGEFLLRGRWLFGDGVLVRWQDQAPGIVADLKPSGSEEGSDTFLFAVGGVESAPVVVRVPVAGTTNVVELMSTADGATWQATTVGSVIGRPSSIGLSADSSTVVVGMSSSGKKHPGLRFMDFPSFAGQLVRFVRSSGWWTMPPFELNDASRGLGVNVALSTSGRTTFATTSGHGANVSMVLLASTPTASPTTMSPTSLAPTTMSPTSRAPTTLPTLSSRRRRRRRAGRAA